MSVTAIPELRIELGPAAEAIQRTGRRLADLLAVVDEPDRRVRWIASAAGPSSIRSSGIAVTLMG